MRETRLDTREESAATWHRRSATMKQPTCSVLEAVIQTVMHPHNETA